MRITNVECFPVWSGGRNYLFVAVDTDEGISGIGKAGLTSRELAVAGAIDHFKPLLIGQDPGRIEHLWQTLSRGGFFPAEGAVAAALSAVLIALLAIHHNAPKAISIAPHPLSARRPSDLAYQDTPVHSGKARRFAPPRQRSTSRQVARARERCAGAHLPLPPPQ